MSVRLPCLACIVKPAAISLVVVCRLLSRRLSASFDPEGRLLRQEASAVRDLYELPGNLRYLLLLKGLICGIYAVHGGDKEEQHRCCQGLGFHGGFLMARCGRSW